MVLPASRQSILYALLIVLAAVLVNLALYKPNYVITDHLEEMSVHGYSDAYYGGKSKIAVDTNHRFSYSYQRAHSQIKHPYAGVSLKKKDSSYFELDNHTIHLKATTTGSNTITFRLELFADNYTQPGNVLSYVFYEKIVSGKNGEIDKEVDVADMEVPIWWIKEQGLVAEDVPPASFDKTAHLVFDHDSSLEIGKTATTDILLLELIPDRTPLIVFNVCLVLSALVFFTFRHFTKKSKIVVPVPYKENYPGQTPVDKEELLIQYLAEHYKEGKLTQTDLSAVIGITPLEISKIIKNKFELSFNQYLNLLRIEEAKRLLIQSDKQIKEIVWDTGYQSEQHFLRVFKSTTGTTPSLFRERHQLPKKK